MFGATIGVCRDRMPAGVQVERSLASVVAGNGGQSAVGAYSALLGACAHDSNLADWVAKFSNYFRVSGRGRSLTQRRRDAEEGRPAKCPNGRERETYRWYVSSTWKRWALSEFMPTSADLRGHATRGDLL